MNLFVSLIIYRSRRIFLSYTVIYSFTDNTTAMANMRNCTASSVAAQRLVSYRLQWMQQHGVSESAERITSKANLWADLLSRGQTDVVLRQASDAGLECEEVEFYEGWRRLLLEEHRAVLDLL